MTPPPVDIVASPQLIEATDLRQVEQWRGALAREPGNAALLRRFCFSCQRRFNNEVVAEIAARLARPPADDVLRAEELLLFVHAKERQGREQAHLSPTNARDLDDTFFRFAGPELKLLQDSAALLVQRYPKLHGAGVVLADTLVARRQFAKADAFYGQFRKHAFADCVAVTSFDAAFHRGLESTARSALADLPPVTWFADFAAAPARAVFISGDHAYFQTYGWPMIASFRAHAPRDIGLAIHIMDVTPEQGAAVKARLADSQHPWSLSGEWTGLHADPITAAAKGYYHAVRFVRFFQLLDRYSAMAAWLLDMDDLICGDATQLFDLLAEADVCAHMLPARMEPRSKVAAHMTGVAATAAGRSFAARLAGYLETFRRSGNLVWGIDQVALFAVLVMMTEEGMPLRTTAVPERVYDGTCDDGKVLWSAKFDDDAPHAARVRARVSGWRAQFGPSF